MPIKLRCGQRRCRNKRPGGRTFPTPFTFGPAPRCPDRTPTLFLFAYTVLIPSHLVNAANYSIWELEFSCPLLRSSCRKEFQEFPIDVFNSVKINPRNDFFAIFKVFFCSFLCRHSEVITQFCDPPRDWQNLQRAGEELDLNPELLHRIQVRYH